MTPVAPSGIEVVHVSPHADDEAVGCPATLLALRDAGWPVTNLLTSLGSPGDRERRRAEAVAAAAVGGFRLVVVDNAIGLTGAAYERAVTDAVLAGVGAGHVVLLSPSPHDNHPRHEAAARATAAACRILREQATWLMYSVWGALPLPTLYYPFREPALSAATLLLEPYVGETARNDFGALVRARAGANRVLGCEQIFGFGAKQDWPEPFAELFTEAVWSDGRWWAGQPRRLDPAAPVATPSPRDITAWVEQRSVRELVGWR